jgi:hypothetical protein
MQITKSIIFATHHFEKLTSLTQIIWKPDMDFLKDEYTLQVMLWIELSYLMMWPTLCFNIDSPMVPVRVEIYFINVLNRRYLYNHPLSVLPFALLPLPFLSSCSCDYL